VACFSDQRSCGIREMVVSCLQVFFIVAVVIIPRKIICLQKCYICSSEVSWEDCNSYSKTKEVVCPLRSPNCVKGELTCTSGEEKKTVFYKRCGAPEKTCNITAEDRPSCPYSESGWSSHFDNNCCDGNFCNSGSSQKISRAGIGVVMVVALWPLTDMY